MKIGIIGKAGSGKDLLAKILEEDYGFYRLSMTEGLEEVCRKKYGMKEKDRALLNRVGNRLFQEDPLYLLRGIEEKVLAHREEDLVLSGVRRPLEYERLKDLGFIFIRIKAPSALRKKRLEEREQKVFSDEDFARLEKSAFERDQDRFLAYEVDNSGSLEDLKLGLRKLLEGLDYFD